MTDHAAPIRALKARYGEEAERRGLTVSLWGYEPEAGADVVHVILFAEQDALETPLPDPAVDAAFTDVIAGDRAAADDAAFAEAAAEAAEMERRLAGGGSILGD